MQLSDVTDSKQKLLIAREFIAKCTADEYSKGPLKVTGHHYPDVDSLVSMYLVNLLLNLGGISCTPVISCSKKDIGKTYEELTSYSTRETMKFLGIDSDKWAIEVDPQNIVLVDQQANESYPGPIIAVIDHRAPQGPINKWDIVMKSSSCAFLIYSIFIQNPSDKDMVKIAAVATILDTMYLRSEKLVQSELEELKNLINVDKLTEQIMEIAIQPPDIDDAFENIKEYQIIEQAPDSPFDIENKERYYEPFKYSAAYLELNSEQYFVDDAPITEVIAKMEEADKNFLFCFYDYFHNKTFFILRAKFYAMKDYVVYSEMLEGIKPRGTFLKGYIESTILPKMARMLFEKAIDMTEEFINLINEMALSYEIAAMQLSTNAFYQGLITTIRTRIVEKASCYNGWIPKKVTMIEFQGKYYGLDLSGTSKTIKEYDSLPDGEDE